MAMMYIPDEFLKDSRPHDGVFIVDVNCQGIVDLAPHQKRWSKMFPNTYKKYMRMVIREELFPGQVIWNVEDDYTIGLITTVDKAIGEDKDNEYFAELFADECVRELAAVLKPNDAVICGIVNRSNGTHHIFNQAVATHGKSLEWLVHRE